MRPFFQLLPSANILNADQVGINLEMTEGRTLEEKGAKHVEARVQRINATTHSFSIQPLISADGVLHEPTLVCFYEPSGAPAKFHNELSPFTSLTAVWSTILVLMLDSGPDVGLMGRIQSSDHQSQGYDSRASDSQANN
jgi:hypothetical protein